jgi:dihydrofolate reductase
MSTVIANMSVSLDGFVNHPTDGVATLFAWYSRGDVVTETAQPDRWEFRTSAEEARILAEVKEATGAILYGRRTFEEADGWGGTHPVGAPVVVLTHSMPPGWPKPDSSIHFVTDGGIEAAIAKAEELAGPDKIVAVGSPDMISQCLNAGLLDELTIDLVACVLGEGTRFLEHLKDTPYELKQTSVRPGDGVTHLGYRVVKP